MASLSDLLADPNAILEVIIAGSYLDSSDDPHTEWFSRSGWTDEPNGPAGIYIPPLADISISFGQQFDPLEPRILSEGFRVDISLINNSIYTDYAGRFDGWNEYSVDRQTWTVYLVGILSTGVVVNLSDVLTTPLYELYGQDIPEVGSDVCIIRAASKHEILNTALQSLTYSPPCLLFPGTASGVINLGDNLDISTTQSFSIWVYLPDPAAVSAVQYLINKDGTTTGYYLAVGLVSGGTIEGGVEITVRGQSPATTVTAANVLQAYRWHRIDIAIGTTTRRIDVDGTTAVTTTSITGSPVVNSLGCKIGLNFRGRMSRLLAYTDDRSNAVMSVEGRTPITGNETNLLEAFLFLEGVGNTVSSSKTGSTLVDISMGAGVLWDNASWHLESILSQYEPLILGTVLRVPVTWIDTAKQIGQITRGALALLQELQSNHTSVSTSNYTVNLTNGTLRVTTGAITGLTWSATATANNLWNSALLFNGTSSKGVATFTMPSGSRYIACHFRPDSAALTSRVIVGWQGAPGSFNLWWGGGVGAAVRIIATNDAGAAFTAKAPLNIGQRYSIFAWLDVANPSIGLQIYVDGDPIATTAISGAWTSTLPTLSIGHRSTDNTLFLPGVVDELVIGNIVGSVDLAQAHHTLPSTASMTGIIGGWHFDEATGSSAASFVGSGSFTLTSTTWTPGRSAPADLARWVLFENGYTEPDLDTDSWFDCLQDVVADCGWFVTNGQKSRDVLDIILANLGFLLYYEFGKWKIRRFVGVTGTPDIELNSVVDLQSSPIESDATDAPIYLWMILYATNNTKVETSNLSVNPATDPARYDYALKPYKSIDKSDFTVLDRFPSAEPRTRLTALLNQKDAETEGARLLPIHKDGADRKIVSIFAHVGSIQPLDELGPLVAEAGINTGDLLVIGVNTEDNVGTVAIWRPARQ